MTLQTDRSPFLAMLLLAAVGCGATGVRNGDDEAGVDAATAGDAGAQDDGGGPADGGSPDSSVTTCATTESCDGVIDEDCDGTVDEGCARCPLMTIACPAGCCPVDRWEVDTASTLGTSLDVALDGTIYFSYAIPSGGAWTSKLAIYDPTPGTWRLVLLGGGNYRTRVKLDAMGRLHVLYSTNGSTLYYKRSDDRGTSFTQPATVGVLDIGGLFDLALDSTGAPHVAYAGDQPYSYSSDLRYAHIGTSGWTSAIVDPDTGSSNFPDIEIGFADRPHIVYEAYHPPGGINQTTKRYLFHNGNRWVFENLDIGASQIQFTSDGYFAAHSLRIAADDTREVLYTRRDGTTDKLILAKRGPLENDTWQVTPLTDATEFVTPVMFVDHHGKRGAISDGLRMHREGTGAAWASTPVGVPGDHAAVARRGKFLYLGYAADNGHPTVTVIDLE